MNSQEANSSSQGNRWNGPTYALFISNSFGSAIVLAGWRLHQSKWEERFNGHSLIRSDFSGDCEIQGNPAVLDALDSGTFELEVLNDSLSRQVGEILTERLIGKTLSSELWQSMSSLGSEPISSNRDLNIGPILSQAGFHAVDFKLCSLPSRRGIIGAPVVYGTRWMRIYVHDRGIITIISSPPVGLWKMEDVRWPHNAIHSRSANWFSPNDSPSGVSDRLMNLVDDITRHQSYFAKSWSAELELWEQRVFRSLTGIAPQILGDDLSNIERELGSLAEFLSECRLSNRNLERRAEVSNLIQSQPNLVRHLVQTHENLSKLYDNDRQKLRSAMALLTTLSSSVQARATEVQRKASERIQQVITLISVIFLAPLIVIGIYGANLRELSTGAEGNLGSLSVWILVALGISWSGLSLLNSRPIVPGSWWRTGLLLLAMLAALIVSTFLSPKSSESLMVTVLGFPFIATLATAAFLRGRGRI